ncbi:helix-turn-helix domain-containing protein [Halorubellus sp. PRR65]|uniref:helix-turn-helix domain-containing protein n=1 Tax=Halorubellus sp. PRR65 TaxID=3098148 RepID=UPI002B2627D8|nr:helix-turn-helix domain-containing protein [Halorubellus sp. PRR65]
MIQQTAATRDRRPTHGYDPTDRREPLAATAWTEPLAATTRTEPLAATARTEPLAATARTEPLAATDHGSMTADPDLSTVADLLADEHAQRVLAATSVEPRSKSELAASCDASLQTVSRRVDDLAAADLLREETRARPDGHHDAVYVATLDRFEVRLRDGDLVHDVARMDRDMTDELQRLWGKF